MVVTMADSPRPGVWALEKSMDNGNTSLVNLRCLFIVFICNKRLEISALDYFASTFDVKAVSSTDLVNLVNVTPDNDHTTNTFLNLILL